MEKKQNLIRPVLCVILFGLAVSLILHSCSITKAVPVSHAPMRVLYLTHVHDTVVKTIPTHKLTQQEMQDLITPTLEYNYKTFFLPQFAQLRAIIGQQQKTLNSQAAANSDMVAILQNMRQRSIKRTDSFQNVSRIKDLRYSHLIEDYNSVQKKQVERNVIQINSLNTLADVLLVLAVIMILCILGLLIAVRILWVRMNNIYEKVAHV